jgi:lactose/L-arabinose transport system substrate-binding protein
MDPESPQRRRHAFLIWFVVITLAAPLAWLVTRLLATPQRPETDAALSLSEIVGTTSRTNDIEVWSWNIAAKSLKAVVPGFNRRYPNIDVFVNMTGANMQTRFFLSLCARTGGPDAMQFQNLEAPRYAASCRLTDLTEVAGKYGRQFAPSFWRNCLHEGRVYAIPWDMGPCAVFYKKPIFDRYGIDPNAIETWDDYIEAGKRIVAESGGQTKMFHMPTSSDMARLFEMLLQQNHGQVFDDEGRIAVNSAQSLQVLRLIRRILRSGIGSNVPFFSPEQLASFQNDTVATYPIAVWFGGTIRNSAPKTAGVWRVFPLPALEPGGPRVSNLGGSVLVIPDQCRKKPEAWAFVEYALCTKEGQLEQYRKFDLFPSLMSTFDDPFFDEPDPFYGGQKVRRLFATGIEKIPHLNRTRYWVEAYRYLGQALSAWADTDESPEDFLTGVEKRMERRIGLELSPSSLSTKGDSP